MPEWEYSKIDLNDLPQKTHEIDLLNVAGGQGWELVLVTSNNIAYLRRALGEEAQARSKRRKTAGSSTDT
jgi:hypothetical protein